MWEGKVKKKIFYNFYNLHPRNTELLPVRESMLKTCGSHQDRKMKE